MTDPACPAGTATTILFGAFDRHNFGDLLFPHVVAAMLGDRHIEYAGLADSDLRAYGGHEVAGILRLAERYESKPVNLVHAGGEILTCNAWQAAAMLLPPGEAKSVIARYDTRPHEAHAWAVERLGLASHAPYCLPRSLFHRAATVIYNAVGGVDLAQCEPELRDEVLANLRAADAVGVRDAATHRVLHDAGIAAQLLPDSAVMVAELFGATIRRHMQQGEVARVLQSFPEGYIAVQFSADFADAGAIPQIASQLDHIAQEHRLGIVFFRAGAAPWHDDLDCYRAVAARMRATGVKIVSSLNLWDICALLAGSRAYVGSSLHGRIVAMAFALPRLSLRPPGLLGKPGKQAAFADTWDRISEPGMADVSDIAAALNRAMSVDEHALRDAAQQLAGAYRCGFQLLFEGLLKGG